ncbi:MAG: 6-carboxytetrahydropterin synthase [Mucinivorans sp.]
METVELTRKFTFEMAHALRGYDGLCRNIHGHSYKLYVTVSGEPCKEPNNPKFGMVIDFADLKKIVNELIVSKLDHSLVVRIGGDLTVLKGLDYRIVETEYQPTCENMVIDFAEKIIPELPHGVQLTKIKLYETENSYATYRP